MRAEKISIKDEIKSALATSDYAIMVNHTGLTVQRSVELRRRLREQKAGARVVRNTLLRVAAAELGSVQPYKTLSGPTTLISGGDVTAVAKVVRDFMKEFKSLEFKGGAVNGVAIGATEVEALADLPSREVLLSMTLGTLAAPMTRLVGVFSSKVRSLLYVLKAVAEKKAA